MNAKIYLEVDGVRTEITEVIKNLIKAYLYYQTSWFYRVVQSFGASEQDTKQYNDNVEAWRESLNTYNDYLDGRLPIEDFLRGGIR